MLRENLTRKSRPYPVEPRFNREGYFKTIEIEAHVMPDAGMRPNPRTVLKFATLRGENGIKVLSSEEALECLTILFLHE